MLLTPGAFAQTFSDFENITLAPDSYNDGSSGSGNFTSGNAVFHNTYNAAWMYWESGFAISNQRDTAVSASDYMTQLYKTKAGVGVDSTANFAIGQQNARISFSAANGAYGVLVTNTTYAYNSMALGDSFGKKFGDTLNSPHSAAGINMGYPDWFKLSVIGYNGGIVNPDTVSFYLADFRFANDSMDYIVKDWQWVDLTTIGVADSLEFILTSSDTGAFGMNTPAFFCIDKFVTHDVATGIAVTDESSVKAYPNPVTDELNVAFDSAAQRSIYVYNMLGELVAEKATTGMNSAIDLESLSPGVYFLNVSAGTINSVIRIVKK
jgi:hypothetical protein